MSMELMVKAMKCKVGNPLRKLVLIKLADNANDQGECWPSYQYIADQCEISKRSVISHIDALIKSGLLRKEIRKGGAKGNASNIYIINFGGAGDSLGVVQEIHHPSAGDSLPPSAGVAPRTSHSIEPVNEPLKSKPKSSGLDFSSWPSEPSEQIFKDWKAMRDKKRAPITQTVINRLASKMVAAGKQFGMSVDDVLGLCVERGWQGFEIEWLANVNRGKPQGVNYVGSDFTGPKGWEEFR
ncbi:helix-turn-helix domain-containing protein [Vibrio fluvialis]|nr:helix-turn-helix domain-containing protein [Vibrio fluvialis]